MTNLHPIQLNFGAFINNPILSDIKVKGNMSDAQVFMNVDDSDMEDSKDDNKFDESNMSLTSLDEIHENEDSVCNIKVSTDGSIYCHWDIIRARCIVFDLLFYYMTQNKTDSLPTDVIHIDMNANIIHFNVSYDALFIVIKYLYTGLIRRYDYDDILIARDVMQLANILHLNQLCVAINGQFLGSRKRLKEKTTPLNNKWQSIAMKLDNFDFAKWNQCNDEHTNKLKYFFNINVLYHFDKKMYRKTGCRQLIKINGKIFQISKIIFVSVSQYFEALFCKNFAKNDMIEINEINANDFEKLQRFLYTFDMEKCYNCDNKYGQLNDLDFQKELELDVASIKKKELLQDCITGFHLSIFFGIDDLRQCLLFLIEKYYLCNHTLHAFWNFGFEYELKDIKQLCINYFSLNFGDISADKEIFNSLTKQMIKCGLSNGTIQVNTQYMITVLLEWAQFHQTSIQELLPPNTLFNEANKSFVLSNRRAINLQHLLRL